MRVGRFLSMGALVCALALTALYATTVEAESLGPIKSGEKRIGDELVLFCQEHMKQELVDHAKEVNEAFVSSALENLSYEKARQSGPIYKVIQLMNPFVDAKVCTFIKILNHIPFAPVYEPPESQRKFIEKAYPTKGALRVFKSLALDEDQEPLGPVYIIT